MDYEKLILEVVVLLSESKGLIAQGKVAEAYIKVAEAEKKLRPVGTGTNGPRPKDYEKID